MGSSTHHPRKLRTKTQTPPRATVPAYRGRRRWPSCHDQVCCSPKSPRKGVWIPRLVPARPSPPQNEESEQNFHRGNAGAPVSLCLSSSDPPWPLTQRGGWGWEAKRRGPDQPLEGPGRALGSLLGTAVQGAPCPGANKPDNERQLLAAPQCLCLPGLPSSPCAAQAWTSGDPRDQQMGPLPPPLTAQIGT